MSSLRIAEPLIAEIMREAVAAYPAECCGLLVGRGNVDDGIEVTRVVVSRNLAADARPDRFEVDPMVRFETMRAVEGTGEDIVGHYHSHPNHPAKPSDTDLAMAYEPELAWLIVGVENGKPGPLHAFRLKPDASAFEAIALNP